MSVRRTRRALAAAVAAGLIGLAAVGCSSDGGADAGPAGKVAEAPPAHAGTLRVLPSAVRDTKIVVGAADAPHTVTVYADPRCPYCAKFEASGGTVLAERAAKGELRIEYGIASFLDARTGGTASARAANALRAAAEEGPGKFAAFQAALFASQPADESKDAFTADHLLRIADRVDGLRGDAFDRAVRDGTHAAWVADAEKAFEDSGVGGTPSVLVDGKALDGGAGLYDADAFGRLLDGALGS
ncbi:MULTISPECIES: DsbA family protein [Streptomyces]|uniref:DsbA family protein n=1 Tax=Streptomyces TaxID=1883 RepID=UPI00278C750C|nr:thioredoxin domain-containing protein [Streptomyces hydrogenans]